MDAVKEYILQNWALILVLGAFIIMLMVTVFLDKITIIRLIILILSIFALSIIVFVEFYLTDKGGYYDARKVLMAIRYSATPVVIALVLYTLVKKAKWYVLLPSLLFVIVNVISIFTGIVFDINKDTGDLIRGALGYLPYIGVGGYSAVLIVILVIQSNKQPTEIIPIVFLALAFVSGLVLPFIFGKEYSKIFCTTIAIALFDYYVFLILQLTKKDALTGLLNRQAYYASLRYGAKDITAIVSIDMNGLKRINDTYGHLAGDEALWTLGYCLRRSAKSKQLVFRIGGDEFIIVCRKSSKVELDQLIERIKDNVSETSYSCSIGYCYSEKEAKSIEEMARESDKMMYADKAFYYSKTGKDRRVSDNK